MNVGNKINICGIDHKIIVCDDYFDADTHMGLINYNTCEIRINKNLSDQLKTATLCHEVVHGMLVHIGRIDLSNDESFVTALGTAINISFFPKIKDCEDMRGEHDE